MSIDHYQQSSMNELLLDDPVLAADGSAAGLDGGGGSSSGAGGAAAGAAKGKGKGPSKHPRLVSLDMVRGLTMAVMILVDEVGGVYPKLNHSPWNNVTFADFVMPWFLFMMGTSMAFSLRRYLKTDADGRRIRKLQWEGSRKVVVRAVKLFLLGVVLQGGNWIDDGEDDPNKADYTYGWNLATLRFCGILNRIGWAFLVVGLAELWFPVVGGASGTSGRAAGCCRGSRVCRSPHLQVFVREAWKWLLGLASLVLYLLVTYLTYVPDWVSLYGTNSTNVTIHCNVSGKFDTPECSAASFWDRTILGQAHLGAWMSTRMTVCSVNSPGSGPLPPDAPQWCTAYMYDPEGLLASVPTVLSTVLGVHFGRVLKAPGIGAPHVSNGVVNGARQSRSIVLHWTVFSATLVAIGLTIHFAGFKMNKQLWSPSYVFFMAGTCGTALIFFYLVADWYNAKWTKFTAMLFRPLQFMGMNAILVFFFHGTAEGLIEAVYVAPIDDDVVANRHTLLSWFYDDCLGTWFPDGDKAGVQLTFTLTKIAIWFVVCYALYRANYFWKI